MDTPTQFYWLRAAAAIASFLWSVAIISFTGTLFVFHMFLISIGKTTCEYLKDAMNIQNTDQQQQQQLSQYSRVNTVLTTETAAATAAVAAVAADVVVGSTASTAENASHPSPLLDTFFSSSTSSPSLTLAAAAAAPAGGATANRTTAPTSIGQMFVETRDVPSLEGGESIFEDDRSSLLLALGPSCKSSRFCHSLFPPRTMMLPMFELEDSVDERLEAAFHKRTMAALIKANLHSPLSENDELAVL